MSDKGMTEFAYSELTKEVRGELMAFAREIRAQAGKHVEVVLEIGRMLCESQKILGNEKSFKSFVENECKFSIRSAYNYMAAHRNFGKCASGARIDVGAMNELAKSDAAVKKAIKIAESGKTVTQSKAKELVAECKPDSPKTAPKPTPSQPDSAPLEGKDDSTEAQATDEAQETDNRPPRNGRDKPVDRGACPNCRGTKWTEDEDGWACSRCHHPWGVETGGDVDEQRIKDQRSKTVKTGEALMRAFDDLQGMIPNSKHKATIDSCKALIQTAKDWR